MNHTFKQLDGLTNRPDLVLVKPGDSCIVDGVFVSVLQLGVAGGFPGSSSTMCGRRVVVLMILRWD